MQASGVDTISNTRVRRVASASITTFTTASSAKWWVVFYRPVYQPPRYQLSRDTPALGQETFSSFLPADFFQFSLVEIRRSARLVVEEKFLRRAAPLSSEHIWMVRYNKYLSIGDVPRLET